MNKEKVAARIVVGDALEMTITEGAEFKITVRCARCDRVVSETLFDVRYTTESEAAQQGIEDALRGLNHICGQETH